MSKTKQWRLAASLLVAVLMLASCGDDQTTLKGKVVKEGVECAVTEVDRKSDAPAVEPIESIEKVGHKDITVGKGCGVDYAQFIQLDIVGATAADGKVFFSSWDTGRPVTTTIGAGTLLPALEMQIADMKVGGRRLVTIPAADAYGEAGSPQQGIGANQDVQFVVDFVAAESKQTYCNAATSIPEGNLPGKPMLVDMPLKPVTELSTNDIRVGDGPEVTKDQYVKVHYLGIACSTGQQFDSSWDRDEPIGVAFGSAPPNDDYSNVIPGWSEGLEGAKVGGIRQINIPPELGYGPAGQGAIGPNETLVFVVEVLEVTDPPAETTTTTAPGDQSSTTAPADDAGDETTTTAAP